MAATSGTFTLFNSFKNKLGSGAIDLSAATTFHAELHHSGANLSADSDLSTWTSIAATSDGVKGSASRALANVTWAVTGVSQFEWGADAIVWTATSDADMTVKYAVFVMSLAVDSGLPIGYIELVGANQVVTSGNTVTLTPSPAWFKLS